MDKSRLDTEVLEHTLISLQLRQENDQLRQAVDVLTRAHAHCTVEQRSDSEEQ